MTKRKRHDEFDEMVKRWLAIKEKTKAEPMPGTDMTVGAWLEMIKEEGKKIDPATAIIDWEWADSQKSLLRLPHRSFTTRHHQGVLRAPTRQQHLGELRRPATERR